MENNISEKILKKLYDTDFEIMSETGQKFEIPESGSLGLLALGYKGVIAWRKKRREKKQKNN